MFPKRIRQARQAAGLSLQKLADRMMAGGHPITRAALNKYELGKAAPTARTLLALSAALRIESRVLLEDVEVRIDWMAIRARRLSKAQQEQVRALAERTVDQQVKLERLLGDTRRIAFPRCADARTPEAAEAAAAALRRAWKLGEAPIASVTSTIEDQGGVVVELAEPVAGFEALCGLADERHPVVVVNSGLPSLPKRETLAQELGRLVLRAQHESALTRRFATAFLLPADVARRELGESRRRISLDELRTLAERHGVSVTAWIHRAQELGIISGAAHKGLYAEAARQAERSGVPHVRDAERASVRMRQLLRHALSEDAVSHDQAYHILPDVLPQTSDAERRPSRLREVLAMSPEDRTRALEASAEAARDLYEEGGELRGFDAMGPEDFHEESDE